MTKSQMEQYDLFLDENDWDIYYWATQSPTNPSSGEDAKGSTKEAPTTPGTPEPPSPATSEAETWQPGASSSGEWAQTIGRFKPAYRPVPQRWKDSEILSLLRKHVRQRSAGGVLEDVQVEPQTKGSGLGRMPDVQVFDS